MIITALLLIASTCHAATWAPVVGPGEGTGISCLLDNQFGSPPQTATPSSESGRASQASSASKNKPLVAAPLPQEERFQL